MRSLIVNENDIKFINALALAAPTAVDRHRDKSCPTMQHQGINIGASLQGGSLDYITWLVAELTSEDTKRQKRG